MSDKQILGSIWVQTNKDGTVSVGLTADFIRTKMGECFHIMQADKDDLVENQPMLVMETNDGLESVRSPVTGRILSFNRRAVDFPDKLKDSESILTILPVGVAPKATTKKPKPVYVNLIGDEFDAF